MIGKCRSIRSQASRKDHSFESPVIENPFELLENLEFPDNLELGFKAEPKRNGGNFKIRKDGKAYEGRVRGEDDREEISGELSLERIDLDDY